MKKLGLLFLVSVLTFTGYSDRSDVGKPGLRDENELQVDLSLIQSGDVVFRHGRGFISSALVTFGQREKKYSHAGIISIENNLAFVYHAMGGEGSESDLLRKEPLIEFCRKSNATAFGIYRADLRQSQILKVLDEAKAAYQNKIGFDTKFDLSTDQKLYCTELIYKAFKKAAGDYYLSLSSISGVQYVSCDDIYLSGHFRPVYLCQY